jgi:hypothetical protein
MSNFLTRRSAINTSSLRISSRISVGILDMHLTPYLSEFSNDIAQDLELLLSHGFLAPCCSNSSRRRRAASDTKSAMLRYRLSFPTCVSMSATRLGFKLTLLYFNLEFDLFI